MQCHWRMHFDMQCQILLSDFSASPLKGLYFLKALWAMQLKHWISQASIYVWYFWCRWRLTRYLIILTPCFAEQQDKLRLIYETFKEQVNQHLQDCKSTFEGLEADELEFKGTLEKRSESTFVASSIFGCFTLSHAHAQFFWSISICVVS